MELVHDFTVPIPPGDAFDLLVDIQRVAPCMPGAAITSADGDTFEGGMKVKLGPISMTFRGNGELVEKDPTARRAVIQARGRDAKGNGGANATVTATLTDRGGSTAVHVITDLNVTGKAAQFGGAVMRDVSNTLLAQFADNLSQMISSGGTKPAGLTTTAALNGATVAAQPPGTPRTATGLPTTEDVTFTPATDSGLDAMSLILGSEALKNVIRPTLIGVAGLFMGYLYGKNRVLERTVRRGI